MEWQGERERRLWVVGEEKSRTRSIALGGVIHTDWVAALHGDRGSDGWLSIAGL